MSNNNQLKLGAVLSYTSIFINIVAGLLYTPWMVQQIGQSQYGLYTLANSLITLFLVDFGLSSATSRYLSIYRAENAQDRISKFLGAVYKLYLIIASVIFVILTVLFFFIDTIYTQLTPTELSQFKVVYIISAGFAVLNFPFVTFNGILTAYEQFIPLKLADVLYRISFVVSTVAALLLGHGLYALVTLHAIVGLLIVLFKFIIIKKKISLKIDFRATDRSMYKEIFSFSIWVTISSLAQRLIFNVAPSVLGIVANSAEIAVFGIIATLESYIYTVISALNGLFLPRISKFVVEDESKLMPLMLKVGRYLFALNGLIFTGFAILGQSFMNLWMGEAYTSAYKGLLLVLFAGLFYNALQIANTTMIATKRVKYQTYVQVTIGVINICLAFPLAKMLGALGACLSIFIAYMARALILHILYHKILPFNMIEFAKKCYFRMSLPIIISIAVGIALNSVIPDGGWLIFCIKGVITVFAYLLFVVLLGLDKAEKETVFSTVRRILAKAIK